MTCFKWRSVRTYFGHHVLVGMDPRTQLPTRDIRFWLLWLSGLTANYRSSSTLHFSFSLNRQPNNGQRALLKNLSARTSSQQSHFGLVATRCGILVTESIVTVLEHLVGRQRFLGQRKIGAQTRKLTILPLTRVHHSLYTESDDIGHIGKSSKWIPLVVSDTVKLPLLVEKIPRLPSVTQTLHGGRFPRTTLRL